MQIIDNSSKYIVHMLQPYRCCCFDFAKELACSLKLPEVSDFQSQFWAEIF